MTTAHCGSCSRHLTTEWARAETRRLGCRTGHRRRDDQTHLLTTGRRPAALRQLRVYEVYLLVTVGVARNCIAVGVLRTSYVLVRPSRRKRKRGQFDASVVICLHGRRIQLTIPAAHIPTLTLTLVSILPRATQFGSGLDVGLTGPYPITSTPYTSVGLRVRSTETSLLGTTSHDSHLRPDSERHLQLTFRSYISTRHSRHSQRPVGKTWLVCAPGKRIPLSSIPPRPPPRVSRLPRARRVENRPPQRLNRCQLPRPRRRQTRSARTSGAKPAAQGRFVPNMNLRRCEVQECGLQSPRRASRGRGRPGHNTWPVATPSAGAVASPWSGEMSMHGRNSLSFIPFLRVAPC